MRRTKDSVMTVYWELSAPVPAAGKPEDNAAEESSNIGSQTLNPRSQAFNPISLNSKS